MVTLLSHPLLPLMASRGSQVPCQARRTSRGHKRHEKVTCTGVPGRQAPPSLLHAPPCIATRSFLQTLVVPHKVVLNFVRIVWGVCFYLCRVVVVVGACTTVVLAWKWRGAGVCGAARGYRSGWRRRVHDRPRPPTEAGGQARRVEGGAEAVQCPSLRLTHRGRL